MKLVLEPTVKIREQIKSQKEVVANEVFVANAIKDLAVIIAPKHTRYYVKHLDVISKRFPAGPTGFHTFVTSEDFAGHMVEWGSVNNRAYAPLRTAVRTLRLKFVESAKGAALAESEKLGKYVRQSTPDRRSEPDMQAVLAAHKSGGTNAKSMKGRGTPDQVARNARNSKAPFSRRNAQRQAEREQRNKVQATPPRRRRTRKTT